MKVTVLLEYLNGVLCIKMGFYYRLSELTQGPKSWIMEEALYMAFQLRVGVSELQACNVNNDIPI